VPVLHDMKTKTYTGTETIRLNNFPVLEAIAPNHAFVKELSNDKREEYTVNLSLLSRTTVAFKYRVHIDETNLAAHAPLILKPAWKPQGEMLGVVIEYKLNPAFSTTSVALHNLVLIATYEGARAAGCQTKPTGTHVKDKSLIYWRLGNVTLDGTMQKVVGRLIGAEGGEPKPGVIEARWEFSNPSGHSFGSGLGVSRLDTSGKGKEKMDSSDPFADESASSSGNWVEVESLRKIISGKYDAKQVNVSIA
jgi:F-BAR domain only protein